MDMLDDCAPSRQNRVAAVVANILAFDGEAPAFAPDDSLYDRGMTSLNMVNLMLAIEAEFGFMIPKRDLHPDNFKSLRAIDGLVSRLTNG
jgi:acyl carrier protein